MKVSLIFPVFSELAEAQLRIQDLKSFWGRFPLEIEIVLVKDPDSDSPSQPENKWTEIIEKAQGQNFHIRLLQNSKRIGRGLSVARGLDECTGEVAIVASFDLNIPLGDFFNIIQEFFQHRETELLILASRRGLKKKRQGSKKGLRKIFEDIEHEKASNLAVEDPTTPTFGIQTQTWKNLENKRIRSWFYTPEIILACRKKSIEVRSIPVNCHDSEKSRMRLRDLFF